MNTILDPHHQFTCCGITPDDIRNRHLTMRPAHGFTLLEVLLSMGIFAVGFVFIASIFPVAALLQKKAADATTAVQVARNAQAVMEGLGVKVTDYLSLDVTYHTDEIVHAFDGNWLNANLQLNTRSFPTTLLDFTNRTYYIVPVFRDKNSIDPSSNTAIGDLVVYAFVLKRQNQTTYSTPTFSYGAVANTATDDGNTIVPHVYKVPVTTIDVKTLKFNAPNTNFNGTGDIPEQLDIGDKFLDNNGTIYEVQSYDMTNNTISVTGVLLNNPTAIWFASPGFDSSGNPSTKGSPTLSILQLTEMGKL